MSDRIRSEQQEPLEPGPPRQPDESPSPQFTAPGEGEPRDTEGTEIAEDAGVHEAMGPEHQAMRIVTDPDSPAYLDE
ncbi:hypothetical protein [Actinokineospora sp. NPDC004072]